MATPSGDLGRVVVLAGGISHERDVSLRSGRRVADSLRSHGLDVELVDPDASLLAALRDDPPDVIWPALHGASGEDGALRGLLEFLGIPFVGSRSDAARLAWDKPTAKAIVARAGVATPRSITLGREAFRVMKAQGIGGSVVFIASKNGMVASNQASAYCAAKASEIQLARCIALEGAAF